MFKRVTKEARRDQNMQSLVRADIFEDDIYEDDIYDSFKDCPSLYVYCKTVHGILKHRNAVNRINMKGKKLVQFLHDEWMQDTKPSHACDKLLEE